MLMFTIRIADRTFEGRKKLVIENEKIYIDHQLIPVSATAITVTGEVGNFESDDSIQVVPGDGNTWIARRTKR